jgi:metal-responsive CopG/Arc/MetJ family transcriptional regulator
LSTTKVAITLDQKTLAELDRLVKRRIFPSRSRAIQEAIDEKLRRLKRTRLAEECSKLDPEFEKALADEGFASELTQWPEY